MLLSTYVITSTFFFKSCMSFTLFSILLWTTCIGLFFVIKVKLLEGSSVTTQVTDSGSLKQFEFWETPSTVSITSLAKEDAGPQKQLPYPPPSPPDTIFLRLKFLSVVISPGWSQTCYWAEDGLELPVLLPSPKCWGCRHVPPCIV